MFSPFMLAVLPGTPTGRDVHTQNNKPLKSPGNLGV